MPDKKPARRHSKSSHNLAKKHRLLKILIIALLVQGIVVGGFLIRYFYIFNGLIEEKLGKKGTISETEI